MELWIDRNAPYAYKLSGTKVEVENRDLRKYTGPLDKNIFQNLTSTLNEIKQYNLLKENAPDRDSLKNLINNHHRTCLLLNDKQQVAKNYRFCNCN